MSIRVKGKGYEGYIFDSSYNIGFTFPSQKTRYTLTPENVSQVEKIITEKIKTLNKERINQGNECPIIDKNLRKYKRQYVGFTNIKEEVVVWANFVWKNSHKDQLDKEIIYGSDGCSHFWNVKVNITTQELFDLQINGRA